MRVEEGRSSASADGNAAQRHEIVKGTELRGDEGVGAGELVNEATPPACEGLVEQGSRWESVSMAARASAEPGPPSKTVLQQPRRKTCGW